MPLPPWSLWWMKKGLGQASGLGRCFVSFSALTLGFDLTLGLTPTGKTMTLAVNFLQKCSRGRHLTHSMVP